MATAPTLLPTIPEVDREHEQSEYVILETPITFPTTYYGYGQLIDGSERQGVVRPYRWTHMLFCALLPPLGAFMAYMLWVAFKTPPSQS